jgi:hypothetical protein
MARRAQQREQSYETYQNRKSSCIRPPVKMPTGILRQAGIRHHVLTSAFAIAIATTTGPY